MKKSILVSLFLLCLSLNANAKGPSGRNGWTQWDGVTVGAPGTSFFGLENKWYNIQINCLSSIGNIDEFFDPSQINVYFEGRGFDEYTIRVNGNSYTGPIRADSRAGSVEFNKLITDLKTSKKFTLYNKNNKEAVVFLNNNTEILPDPFEENSCEVLL